MELLLFKTDIKSNKKVASLKPLFNNHPDIIKWTVDTDDIDNVLKIEATIELAEKDVMDLVRKHGFHIRTL